MIEETQRTAETIAQAHKACLDGARNIDRVIATHAKGNDAVDEDFGSDMTHEEKKARVRRSVGYLKYQKENFDDWGDLSFTDIDAAITAADNFTGD
tara:strand:+ start:32 stop:319 length:288 start_codon:yes stop_codon:yes gene_type:complete